MDKQNVAMTGLGVMGATLLLDPESRGFTGAGRGGNTLAIGRFLSSPARGNQVVGAAGWADRASRWIPY